MIEVGRTKPCPGYWYGGNYSYLNGGCPELARQSGCRPGGGKGYPQGWDKACPTCHNVGHYHGRQPEMAVVSHPDGSYSSWGPVWQIGKTLSPFMVLGDWVGIDVIANHLRKAVTKGRIQGRIQGWYDTLLRRH